MVAFEQIKQCIENNMSFVVEAGAGSGKTYSLIQTLNYLVENRNVILQAKRQHIICITYTNVAKNEIIKRIEYNDLVVVVTIHEFLWQSIKPFQNQLKIELCKLNEVRLGEDESKGKESRYIANLQSRIQDVKEVFYNDSSFRNFEKGELHHDDVIELSKIVFGNYPLLTSIVTQKYPFIFVDEYQDTSMETVQVLVDYLLSRNKGNIILGFYGDSHQKIYDNGIGSLESYYTGENRLLELIKKEENYRSSTSIVNLLNRFRVNIQQTPKRDVVGSVKFIFWGNHPEIPKKGIRDFNRGLNEPKNKIYTSILDKFVSLGWNFKSDSEDKILVLANSRIADRAGFLNLYEAYSKRYGQSVKERLLDRNHFLIKFFTGYIDKKTSQERRVGLEHLIKYWIDGNHNQVIRFLRRNGTALYQFQHHKKKELSDILNGLVENRFEKTVRDVLNVGLQNGIIYSKNYEDFLERIYQDLEGADPDIKDKIEQDITFYESVMNLPYNEILCFWRHIKNETVFSTKHGTKGDEYRNVLTVIDDTEWIQQYNFNNFFDDSDENAERKLRTRNLFYVECSRAKENLAILMLSKIGDKALANIKGWFGNDSVVEAEEFLKI